MKQRMSAAGFLAMAIVSCSISRPPDTSFSRLPATSSSRIPEGGGRSPTKQLCVDSGPVATKAPGHFHVDVGMMRSTAGVKGDSAELVFTYAGASSTIVPLGNGEVRRQIGLKLHAKDTCNVVYVMWHVAPTPGIAVSVKSNPNASTHEACGDKGYLNVNPTTAHAAAAILPGVSHTLRAELHGDILEVLADGLLAWEGRLPSAVFAIEGPAGVRSDNGAFDFELHVPGGDSPPAHCMASRLTSL